MENEKKTSRLGVRLSAVMIAVLLVVCMAVPASSATVGVPSHGNVEIPDNASFGFVCKKKSGELCAYYILDPVDVYVQPYMFYESYRSLNVAIPESRFATRPYVLVEYMSGYSPTIYMYSEPFAVVDGKLTTGEEIVATQGSLSKDGTITWSGGRADTFPYLTVTFCNYDLKDGAGALLRSADSFFSRVYFGSDGNSVSAMRSVFSGDEWSSYEAVTLRYIDIASVGDVYYVSDDLMTEGGSVFVEGYRTPLTQVGVGLTVVLDWVGATVSALFSGSLSGLLPLVAVPVAITLLIVAIVFIKRSIWGA